MATEKDNLNKDDGLDKRLGTPMKKVAGLSCDMKKSESEHLYAFREDVNIGGSTKEKEDAEEDSEREDVPPP